MKAEIRFLRYILLFVSNTYLNRFSKRDIYIHRWDTKWHVGLIKSSVLLATLFVFTPHVDEAGKIRITHSASAQSSSNYLLNDHPSAHAAYGMRLLSSSYSGPVMRIRRSSDNAEVDIQFDANGELSLNSPVTNASNASSYTSLADFAGSSTCWVVAWYDQSSGGAHLILQPSSASSEFDPRLIEDGALVLNDMNRPAIRWESSPTWDDENGLLYTDGMNGLTNTDQTTFLIFQHDTEYKNLNVLYNASVPGTLSLEYLWFQSTTDLSVRIGNSVRELPTAPRPNTASYTLDVDNSTFRLFINRTQGGASWSHNANSRSSEGITLGAESREATHGFTGFLSEVVIYPKLSDANREDIFENYLNPYWEFVPETINTSALLPQEFQYQFDLYNWLNSLTISDVTLPVGAEVRWDGTYSNQDELARLWAETIRDGDNVREFTRVTTSEPKWYVIDDGNGSGIEGYGKAQGDNRVRRPADMDPTLGSHHLASEAAWWYQWDLPLAGGGQGNPVYQHPGMANRALVLAAVELMMLDAAITSGQAGSGRGNRTDDIGGFLTAIADAYVLAKDVLNMSDPVDAAAAAAFEDGMLRLVNQMIRLGAHDVNSNMDGKGIEGCAILYKAVSSNELKDACIRASRKILFGYEDGSLAKIDSDRGIFYIEGLIREADGPETTYNGRSVAHLAAARVHSYGEPEWAFLDDVLTRVCDFTFHQFYTKPNGETVTPDAYSNRTTGGMMYPQDTPWGKMALGAIYEECQPYIWMWPWQRAWVEPPSELVEQIFTRINEIGSVPEYSDNALAWEITEPWPRIAPYLPPVPNWYGTLRSIIDSQGYLHPNHPSRNHSYNRTFPASSEAGSDWQTTEQWWARRSGNAPNQFSYFIESTAYSGVYEGYYSGKIEAFWRQGQGPVILSRREKKSIAYGWSNVDLWRTEHVWGRAASGNAFSWGLVNGSKDDGSPLARTVEWDETNQVLSVVSPMSDRGQQSGNALNGSSTLTKTFTALSDGLEVQTEVTSDGSDRVNELWLTIPIFHGGVGDGIRLPNGFSLEYWTGSSWSQLGESRVQTEKVRVGHDWGFGYYFSEITFEGAQSIQLRSPDSSKDEQRIYLLYVDLLNNGGSPANMPARTSVTYAVRAVDGDSQPSNRPPTVALTNPGDGDSFQAPADITVTAVASDADGSVTKVEFLQGNTVLGEDSNGGDGWSYSWEGVSAGSYSLTARATDNRGEVVTSSAVTFNVLNPGSNQPPSVSITSPSNRDTFGASSDITLVADANDPDGSIRSVEFFSINGKLGDASNSGGGWTFSWEDVSPGSYTITARATDNLNASSTSSAINIVVESVSEGSFIVAPQASMVVDGNLNDWSSIQRLEIDDYNVSLSPPSSDDDNSGDFAVAWDNEFLYLMVRIRDDQYDVSGSDKVWELDGIELLIDGLNNKSTSMQDDDHQIIIRADAGEFMSPSDLSANDVISASSLTGNGYRIEVAVRWSAIGGNMPQANQAYGFNLAVNDRDNGVIEHQIMETYVPNHFVDTSGWNTLMLSGDAPLPTDDEGPDSVVPLDYALHQNYPNPFHDETTLVIDVPSTSMVELSVFDISGRMVETIISDVFEGGTHQVIWNSRNLAGGIYLIRMQTEQGVFYQQATLIN